MSSGLRQNPYPSRKSSQKSLPFIHEDFEDLHISDKHEPPSPGYDPDMKCRAERASKNSSTPESRKKSGSSTGSKQKKSARAADPNSGQCLLTNRPEAVETCHLVAGATTSDDVMQFEYAWGWRHGHFHLDTRHNLFFLRADWHHLFDQGSWTLIPDLSVLEKLHQVTVAGAPKDRSQINLNKTFRRRHFKYHLLPMPELKAPICRFENPNNPREHSTHHYPFTTLGPLVSHVKPQYVVVNTARKLGKTPLSQLPQLQSLLQQVSSHRKKDTAVARLQLILDLYERWTTLAIPDDFTRPAGGNGSGDADHPPSNQASSAASDADQSDDDRESNDSGELSTPSKSKQEQQHHDDVESTSSTQSLEDAIMEDNDWNPSEETVWLEEICDWAENCRHAATSRGGWESGVLNDDQVATYAREPPHSAPLPESWHEWQPRWDRCEGQRPPFNTAKFSSNDWAVYEEHTYLTGTVF
ncbi:hypothetical protein EV363DRAFT_1373016 [Boletus edulis]|nr:hypothetical protein EV363DRAFT_1373016 [Boletus edulis]